jgi:hypothetical protein
VKGKFDLSGNPTITDNGITLRLKRLYSNTKITIGELTVEGDPSVRLLTVELKKGSNCAENNEILPKDEKSRICTGIYTFKLNIQEDTHSPQHRYKSLRLDTKGTATGGQRDGILIHTGWNYGFTEGCILTMNYSDVQKVIDDPQNYINNVNGSISSISSYDFGMRTLITFSRSQPKITDNTEITFKGFTGYTGYNDTFTATKINDNLVVINHVFHEEADVKNASFTAETGESIISVNWNNSAPTTMSLYEYVEKHVPNSITKGKVVITEDDETVNVPSTLEIFLQRVVNVFSNMLN